jgi:hypothetical protein
MTPKDTSLEKLRQVAMAEAQAVKDRLARYVTLTEKMVNYQAGNGPAPSVDDFLEWRADVELALAIKQLQKNLPAR